MQEKEKRAGEAAGPGLGTLELPPASAEQRAALKGSLAAEGLLNPVVVSAGPARRGEVADGLARLELCAELGIDCRREERAVASEDEVRLYRLGTNLKRRQGPAAQLGRIGL